MGDQSGGGGKSRGQEEEKFLSLLQECRVSKAGISPEDAKKLVNTSKKGGERGW